MIASCQSPDLQYNAHLTIPAASSGSAHSLRCANVDLAADNTHNFSLSLCDVCCIPNSGQEESVQLETELLSLHSRLYQLETQQAHLSSSSPTDEGTLLQLVMEISSIQQQASHVISNDVMSLC